MIIGPKYKIARRLNAPIFEKTQTQKYALSQERRAKASKSRPKAKTNYGRQLNEKQKARFTYGVSEKQFSKYVNVVMAKKGVNQVEHLLEILENRFDNVVYRLGLASTRRFARQMVSHGHFMVNGRKLNIPSYQVALGDVITVRPGSAKTKLFANLEEKLKTHTTPAWLSFDQEKVVAKVEGAPKLVATDLLFDPKTVLEFYSR